VSGIAKFGCSIERHCPKAIPNMHHLSCNHHQPVIVKTKYNTVRLLLATAVFGVLALFAIAGSDLQSYQTLRSPDQFKQLKTGDKVAYVCNECKTVSEITIKSPAHAMELCTEGASVMCPSCKTKTKVVMKGARNDPPNRTEVVYTNDKGEECAFFVKVADNK